MSYEQLLAISKEAREIAQEERDAERKRLDCPHDGTPLLYNPKRGLWICEHGDYQRSGGS